ncbi:MAG TPA: hypothetical protein VFC07_08915 [Verrucomicrobiae bacterium]|nr:hypothetical protein [Verrucomicrobiae bacterium]
MDAITDPLRNVRYEILTYLGNFPEKIKAHGSEAYPELILSLGNCLVWISSQLDGHRRTVEAPDMAAQSVLTLGKQFQIIGRENFHEPEEKDSQLQGAVKYMQEQLADLQKRLNRNESKGKGAK